MTLKARRNTTERVDALESPAEHEILVSVANGFGSTGVGARRFSSVDKIVGTALSYVDDPVYGGYILVNEPGMYFMAFADYHNSGNVGQALTVGEPDGNTSGNPSLPYRLGKVVYNSDTSAHAQISSGMRRLTPGTKIRGRVEPAGGWINGDDATWMQVVKVGD